MEPKKSPFNYLYYGAFFGILVLLIMGSMHARGNISGSQIFFFLYAIGQVVLEITFFIAAGLLIQAYLGKLCFALFVGGTFIALFLHIFDFFMDRILDLSIWEALRIFVFDESLGNFFYLLDASGISVWLWLAFFALLALLPLIGFLLYKMSNYLAEKRQISLSQNHFLQAFLCIPLALFLWDYSASKVIHPDDYTAFLKSLPWKCTFLQPENTLLSFSDSLHPPLSEKAVAETIAQNPVHLHKKPNIYLFVVESLREDAITPEIAPHLAEFRENAIHFDHAISNGNGTHLSWFSIFHSQFPYHWKHFQQNWKMGSPALHLLKKWGYQVRLYTSAQLSYYGMEQLLFGNLIDSNQTFHHAPPLTAADTDAKSLAKLQQDLRDHPELQEGQIFIIFWDCTHFEYSWPKTWTPKFTPFAQEFAYFKTFHSEKAIRSIKNRYNNAVHYMDTLFGSFIQQLPNKEEAIIVFTGDHGEEFFEQGHLFHNSHLTRQQTNIPFYLKFGNQERKIIERPLASQMDIFPSIIDYLSGSTVPFLEGNSLFQQPAWPFVVTARFNAGRTPYEFAVHNGANKLIARFANRKNILESNQLQIISLRTAHDNRVATPEVEAWIDQEFGHALKRMFSNSNSESRK
jgi:glucan phosphoethanolaminetransferase (alkaline phosphatase superfamily)